MARLIVREGQGAGAEHDLPDGPVRIGRTVEGGITVSDSKASRAHAEILRREGGLYVRDLESQNGTFVNGGRIEEEVPLRPGDRIRVGDTVLELVGDVGEVAAAPTGAAEEPSVAAPPVAPGRRRARAGDRFVSRLTTVAGVATFVIVAAFALGGLLKSGPARPFDASRPGGDADAENVVAERVAGPSGPAGPELEEAPPSRAPSELEPAEAGRPGPDAPSGPEGPSRDLRPRDAMGSAPVPGGRGSPAADAAYPDASAPAEPGPTRAGTEDPAEEAGDPLAEALARVPSADDLVGELKAWSVANAGELVGTTASLKIGRGQATRVKLGRIDGEEVGGRAGALDLAATWEKLGREGAYVLCRSLVAKAPPGVHAAHVLLGVRLAFEDGAAHVADELDDEVAELWRKDAAAARRADEILKAVRAAKAAKLARAAEARKSPATEDAKGPAYAEAPASYELVLPQGAGHKDVRRDYGAVGDGKTDDTAALLKAISENFDYHSRMLFLPRGTYLVTDTLVSKLPSGSPYFGTQLVGQSREHTVIRLKDGCPGFQDPARPKAVVKLCSRDQLDGGNMGHKNFVQNLTIDTGKGNPGAVAIDYCASNTGALRDVTFRSGDGAGVCGIDMTKPWPGPCLVTNVLVQGFDHGIMTRHSEYSVTFEHVTLERQNVCGLRNDGNVVCMRKLKSLNAGPAVESQGMLIVLDGDLRGAGAGPAVKSRGLTYLRNVKAENYAGVVAGQPNVVGEYCSKPPKSLFPTLSRSLCLPVEDTPFVPYDPPELCAVAGRNIQAALDSGKSTVIIPFGEYRVNETLVIRGNVRRIHAMNSNVWAGDRLGDAPIWRYEGGRHPAVVMEWMDSGTVVHASRNALVIRDCTGLAPRNVPGAGPLFVENDCSDPWVLEHPQKVWGRSVNLEHAEFNIKNHGAWLWILGFKSERPGVQIETTGGGYTEVLGGLVYPCSAVPADRPMFVNDESGLSVMIRQTSYVANGIHKVKVRETRDGATKTLEDLGESLYCGYKVPPEIAGKRARAKGEEP